MGKDKYYEVLSYVFSDKYVGRVVKEYPCPTPASGDQVDCRATLAEVFTDALFLCPNRYALNSIIKTQPAYYYIFDHVSMCVWRMCVV